MSIRSTKNTGALSEAAPGSDERPEGLGALAAQPEPPLEPIPGELTATSYRPPENLTFERWASIGEALQQIERSVQWWLGDWWAFGERKFGERAAQGVRDQVAQATGRKMQTIYDYGWVSRAVPPSMRKEALSFDHHRSVARLAAEHPEETARLLDQAAAEPRRWSAVDLKTEARKVERELALARPAPSVETLPPDVRIEVADAAALPLEDESVDLVLTSPPYALELDYPSGDVAAEGWPEFMRAWLREAFRVTREHGRLALNIPLDTTTGGFRPAYAQAVRAALEAGWRYRATIVWDEGNLSKSNGRGSVDSPQAPHVVMPIEMIGLFSRGEWRRDPSGRSWDLTHQEWLESTTQVWRFAGESNGWEGFEGAFPIELPRRLLKLLTFCDDVVCDPFVGSGTTALAAARLGRRFVGFDISPSQVDSAQRRLAAAYGRGIGRG